MYTILRKVRRELGLETVLVQELVSFLESPSRRDPACLYRYHRCWMGLDQQDLRSLRKTQCK